MMVAVFGFSTPVFVVGYLLAYVFALQLDWLPVQGFTSITEGLCPFLRNLILPAVALGPDLHGAARPHHPRDHAGCAVAGLCAHREGEGRRRRKASCSCTR